MRQLKYRHYLLVLSLFMFLGSCKVTKEQKSTARRASDFSENYSYSKHFDEESATYYYLTKINHKDKKGRLLKLRNGMAEKKEGETALEFAERTKSDLVFNASLGKQNLGPGVRQPIGIQIVDGKIVQDLTWKYYTLGIKDDNELLAFKPRVRAQEVLDAGATNALTAFIPLIEDHKPVSEEIFKIAGHLQKHPRQVIAQFDNLDILFLSCGGRGIDGEGMTAKDLVRILEKLNVKFAFNLDGGGSVSTVLEGRLITKHIDEKGTKPRPRANFLYVRRN
ncbi:MAG TPA: phosphodiester glycosidase family protein [Sphingobacteriaceae bacterium]